MRMLPKILSKDISAWRFIDVICHEFHKSGSIEIMDLYRMVIHLKPSLFLFLHLAPRRLRLLHNLLL
jgi:hypothetical protein